MIAEEFDKKFDDHEEDILQYFDVSKARQPNLEPKRININFPAWMVQCLDDEASNTG